jgi:arylsulfatase A-like enzyme
MYDITKWGKGTIYNEGLQMPQTLHQPANELPPFLENLRKSKIGIWCLGLAADDEQLYRNYIGSYYALVSEIDARVGEIFAELEKNGMSENTIVVYTTDHGDFVGYHGMIEKAALGHNVYEETLRVPLMFFWKGKSAPNFKCDDLVGLIDIYPTLIELTGIKKPTLKYELQGISLAKTVTKKKQTNRNYIVSENWSQASVIAKEYKLGIMLDPTTAADKRDFRSYGDMLFNRKTDPYEVNNQINAPELATTKQLLFYYYADFEKKISDLGKTEMANKATKK